MAVFGVPPRRVFVVGAGASFPYSLPLARDLLANAASRITSIAKQYEDLTIGRMPSYTPETAKKIITQKKELSAAVLNSMTVQHGPLEVAKIFQNSLVQQNLDDFVRDHPSLTNIVATLISTSLFSSLYQKVDYGWKLRSQFVVGGGEFDKDWMRKFVGIIRPMASETNKCSIISFNYDGLLERAMGMYWDGAETKYSKLEDSVSFIYPHGRFSELPDTISSSSEFISEQAQRLKIGKNRDEISRRSAKNAIANATKIFSVGFSFSDTNIDLLGFNKERSSFTYVQNFQNEDIRLTRKLDGWNHLPSHRDSGDMDRLVVNGFFEQ